MVTFAIVWSVWCVPTSAFSVGLGGEWNTSQRACIRTPCQSAPNLCPRKPGWPAVPPSAHSSKGLCAGYSRPFLIPFWKQLCFQRFSSCAHLSHIPWGPQASSFTGQGARRAVDSGHRFLALNLVLALGSVGPWANYLTSLCSISSSIRWGNCT